MTVRDVAQQELTALRWESAKPFAVYFYTPLCGTCKMGERMLSVAHELVPEAKLYKGNINFMPAIAQEWKVESVPCLAFVEGKRVKEKVYTMRSVEFLLGLLRERLIHEHGRR